MEAERSGDKRVGAVDLDIKPLYMVYTSDGKTFSEDANEREILLSKKEGIEQLEGRIAKYDFNAHDGKQEGRANRQTRNNTI